MRRIQRDVGFHSTNEATEPEIKHNLQQYVDYRENIQS